MLTYLLTTSIPIIECTTARLNGSIKKINTWINMLRFIIILPTLQFSLMLHIFLPNHYNVIIAAMQVPATLANKNIIPKYIAKNNTTVDNPR